MGAQRERNAVMGAEAEVEPLKVEEEPQAKQCRGLTEAGR